MTGQPFVPSAEEVTTIVADSPWTRDSIRTLMQVSGLHHTTSTPLREEYQTFEWQTPIRLAGQDLWLLVLALIEDDGTWLWIIEVWETPDESGQVYQQVRTKDENVLLDLVGGILALSDHEHTARPS